MPSTPVPNTGWMVLVQLKKLDVDISADKAMKFIIGGRLAAQAISIGWKKKN